MYFFEDTHEHLVDDDVFEIDDVDCSEEYLTYDEEMERFEFDQQQFDDEPFSADSDDFVESP